MRVIWSSVGFIIRRLEWEKTTVLERMDSLYRSSSFNCSWMFRIRYGRYPMLHFHWCLCSWFFWISFLILDFEVAIYMEICDRLFRSWLIVNMNLFLFLLSLKLLVATVTKFASILQWKRIIWTIFLDSRTGESCFKAVARYLKSQPERWRYLV